MESRGRGRLGRAIAAPALAFSAMRHGVEKLSKHRFRQQVVRFSLGGMSLVAQPPIGSPMHIPATGNPVGLP